MGALEKIIQILNSRRQERKPYHIPAIWLGVDRVDEIEIDPYEVINKKLEQLMRRQSIPRTNEPLYLKTVYSLFPRMFTAYDHQKRGIEPGSFLKAMLLIDHIASIADIVYLLPVTKVSGEYKKGELGSPYAVKDFFKLDETLHDPLLGEYNEALLEDEFSAFVEACHNRGLLVMSDFVFRTCARDNVLLREHPDWFYWVKSGMRFCVPSVPELPELTPVSKSNAPMLYAACNDSYFDAFRNAPDKEWMAVHKNDEALLSAIETELGITTAPAFSDVLNDPQPLWTDVTYLRFDMGRNELGALLPPQQPPCVTQDVIKLDVFKPGKPNFELWDLLEGIIPSFIHRFGIDGARIDMGHALPKALLGRIIAKAKAENSDFIFWSEVMDASKSIQAKNDGFDFISGNTWSRYPALNKNLFELMDELVQLVVPMLASLETPDTPRAALRYRDKWLLYGLTLFNALLPNTLPLVNAGQECAELQPMNLGLDNTEEGRYVLDKRDAMYGKLAFFDNVMLHWDQFDAALVKRLMDARQIRKQYASAFGERPEPVSQGNICGFKMGKLIVALNYGGNAAELKLDRRVICVYERGSESRRIENGLVDLDAYDLIILEEL